MSWTGIISFSGQAVSQATVSVTDEAGLIREAQGGSRAAFEELVRRYDRQVLRLAMNLTRGTEDARDVYQESFLKVYKNLDRFRFQCSFYTWLYRVVTNVCLDHLRRRNTRREAPAPSLRRGGSAEAADAPDFFEVQPEQRPHADPERRLLGLEIGRQIAAALGELSPRERMVFELKHYQGMKMRAIAEVLATSEETVKNGLFRATRKLRARLGDLV